MKITFSTKARTLAALSERVETAKIAPLYYFSAEEWVSERAKIISTVKAKFNNRELIVRSSCSREDNLRVSNAGKFDSILNVKRSEIGSAVDKVIESYGVKTPSDEVLIQPMIENVTLSGVVFSHDPNTCSPYRVINYASGSDTSVVTSGNGGQIIYRAAEAPREESQSFKEVLSLLDELLEIFEQVPIDLEFAFSKTREKSTLWLLQVRPLILLSEVETVEKQTSRLHIVRSKIEEAKSANPFLVGSTTVLGVMPDWNPAEIIGVKPKPLALSLYRELITDTTWAYQRHNYGYRNLRSHRLMRSLFGLPYIDVRISFNSFIPSDLNESLSGRLVDYYTNKLIERPDLHDKVEFEIVWSCFTFDLPEKLESLPAAKFSQSDKKEILDSLRRVTNSVLHPVRGLWLKDAEKIKTLAERRLKVRRSKLNLIDRVYWLIEDVKRYGTLPFAGLARACFMGIQILRSLVDRNILTKHDYDKFLADTSTISKEMYLDRLQLNKQEFLKKYGHLRPGTYDILSSRYDETPDLYFDWEKVARPPKVQEKFTLERNQFCQIESLIREYQLETDPNSLLDFIKSTIELRELSKFEFSHNLSDVLQIIGQIGKAENIAPEDMAYCNIKKFQEIHVSACEPGEAMRESIKVGKESYFETCKLSLPPIISSPEDVFRFELPESQPSFITHKRVEACVVGVEEVGNLNNAIVCIHSADPGFDWLFSYPIAGLITEWGGANSHMAIRASERGLPAVIGAGALLFQRWSRAEKLLVDCASEKVVVLL